jgi:nitrite reductase/ring-hydroxylating ferredoxin subunit
MRSLLVLVAAILLTACSADDIISRRYPCSFVLNYEHHPTSLLFAAARSAGTYVYVTTTGDGKTSVRHVYVTINDGKTPREDNVISTDKENYAAFRLGASNNIGLIIGMTNFNGLVAYDRCCPNCMAQTAMDFTGNRQQVACSKCQRTYDLETGGIRSGDAGEPLMRYNCSFDGILLRAWN